jgi:lipoprotein-anchoring transpeptidase ErfK/SrfK
MRQADHEVVEGSRRWRQGMAWLAAACALAVVAATAACGGLSGIPPAASSTSTSTTVPGRSTTTSQPPATTTTTVPPATTTTTTVPPATTTTTTVPPATTTTVPAAANLAPGDSGAQVLALQERLTQLGYWLGTPDGYFGDSTEQAVYALQKAAGLPRDGVVGPRTRAALAQGVVPHPRTTSGDAVDVDLAADLLMIVRDGRLFATLNTSTGGGYLYWDGGEEAVAQTPVGVFHVYSKVDGLVVDSLGALWRPEYFDSGFAIHGDSYVPPEPVSHGCVRVSDEAIDWIWAGDLIPLGMTVWVY